MDTSVPSSPVSPASPSEEFDDQTSDAQPLLDDIAAPIVVDRPFRNTRSAGHVFDPCHGKDQGETAGHTEQPGLLGL